MRQEDSKSFRLLLLGATGGTGRAVIDVALRAGYTVTAESRDRSPYFREAGEPAYLHSAPRIAV